VLNLRKALERPAVLVGAMGAVSTLGVAIAGAVFGLVSSYIQSRSESEKLRSSILLEIVKPIDMPGVDADGARKVRVKLLIQSGILSDEDGRLCRTFVAENCPIKPP
jgi:hypothetical protein